LLERRGIIVVGFGDEAALPQMTGNLGEALPSLKLLDVPFEAD